MNKFGVKDTRRKSVPTIKIWKLHVKSNLGIIGEHCIRNDDGVLAFSDKDKKIARKSHPEKHLSTEFA